MPESLNPHPRIFQDAIDSLEQAQLRSDIVLSEISAPGSIAPHAIAYAADVRPNGHAEESDWGTGRFVLLYDPQEPEGWGGVWRVICFVQGPLEPEIGAEQYVADVAWSWLVEALEDRQAAYHSLSGTATKQLSRGYGGLADQGDGAQLELRASWSPDTHELGPHLEAWSELLALMAGLPPAEGENVSVLDARRRARD